MAQFEPYLSFNGNCAEAMRFYEKTLGGKIEMMMKFSEAPPDPSYPKVEGDAIMHAVDDARWPSPDGVGHAAGDAVRADEGHDGLAVLQDRGGRAKIFDALSDGGQVQMPYGKTFWADGFGMCVDRFGTPWMVNAGDAGGAQS